LQEYAMMNYRRGFDLSKKRSIHAANGVGMVLLEQGFMSEAKTIFQRVRESTEDFPDGWTNLAHLYVAEKEYFQAIKLYEKCNKKFYSNADTGLLQFIARALFDWSRNWQDKGDLDMATQKMQECQQYCARSLHLDPSNHVLWFNLAVAKLAGASCVIKQKEPSVGGVRKAMAELEQAKRLFSSLGESTATEKELGFKKAKAVENVNACDSRANDAEAALERALEREEKLKTEDGKRIAAMEKMRALQNEKAAAEKAERDRIAADKAELVRVQKEKRQRVLDALANQQVEEQIRKSVTKKRKKGDDYEPENEGVDALGAREGDDAKRQKADGEASAPTNDDLFGTDSSDDEQDDRAPKQQESAKENKIAEDDDDDDDLDLDDSDDEVPTKPEETKGNETQASPNTADTNDDDLDLDDDDDEPAKSSNTDASAVPAGEEKAQVDADGAPTKKKARVMMDSDEEDD
jgi:tetratricopeptide (TPR) repeat protein